MSGASDAYLHAAKVLGADATIHKPIAIDILLDLLHRAPPPRPTSPSGLNSKILTQHS
jgi:hypothetical protein